MSFSDREIIGGSVLGGLQIGGAKKKNRVLGGFGVGGLNIGVAKKKKRVQKLKRGGLVIGGFGVGGKLKSAKKGGFPFAALLPYVAPAIIGLIAKKVGLGSKKKSNNRGNVGVVIKGPSKKGFAPFVFKVGGAENVTNQDQCMKLDLPQNGDNLDISNLFQHRHDIDDLQEEEMILHPDSDKMVELAENFIAELLSNPITEQEAQIASIMQQLPPFRQETIIKQAVQNVIQDSIKALQKKRVPIIEISAEKINMKPVPTGPTGMGRSIKPRIAKKTAKKKGGASSGNQNKWLDFVKSGWPKFKQENPSLHFKNWLNSASSLYHSS